jgi:hypothetical protein
MGSVADLKDGEVPWGIYLCHLKGCRVANSCMQLSSAAVKDGLQSKGLLPQLQANIRSQIFHLLLASEVRP